jgi:hypothetical protein
LALEISDIVLTYQSGKISKVRISVYALAEMRSSSGPKTRVVAVVVTVLLATVLLAACGGDGNEGSTATSQPTIATSSRSKAEFLKLANGICNRERTRLVTEVGEFLREHKGNGKKQNELIAEAMATILLPQLETQIAEIRALGVPRGDQKQVEAILAAFQGAVDAKDHFELADLRPSAKLARAYGLQSCAYVS